MESMVTCYVCLDVMKIPVVLPCGHSLCRLCALRSFTVSPECGMCKVPLGALKAKNLPVNFALQSMLRERGGDAYRTEMKEAESEIAAALALLGDPRSPSVSREGAHLPADPRGRDSGGMQRQAVSDLFQRLEADAIVPPEEEQARFSRDHLHLRDGLLGHEEVNQSIVLSLGGMPYGRRLGAAAAAATAWAPLLNMDIRNPFRDSSESVRGNPIDPIPGSGIRPNTLALNLSFTSAPSENPVDFLSAFGHTSLPDTERG